MSARRWGITAGLGMILFAILLALTAFGIWKLGTWIGFFLVYSWVLTQITSYGLDSNLAKIASVVIGCAVWFGALRLMKKNLVWGAIIVITLIIAQSSFLYVMSRNRYFNPTSGSPTKYYTMNPVSGQYELFDQPIYDSFGQQAQPVTAEIATKIERRKNTNNCANNVVAADRIEKFFDPESGQALVFYCKDPEGKYRLFSSPGYDPKTGQKLEPVNTTVMNDIISVKTPIEKPKKQGLMIFQNTDSAGMHTVCDFSGDYQILAGGSIVDTGAIKHGVCELNWWKAGAEIKVRWRSWGGKYSTSVFCKLKNSHYVMMNFPPPAAQSTQAPAQAPPETVATNTPPVGPQTKPKYISSKPPETGVSRRKRKSQGRQSDHASDQRKAYDDYRAQQAYQASYNQYYASVAARQKPTYYSQQVATINVRPDPVTTQAVTLPATYHATREADPGQPVIRPSSVSTPTTYSYHPVKKADPGNPVAYTQVFAPTKTYVPRTSTAYGPNPFSAQSSALKPVCPNCGRRH